MRSSALFLPPLVLAAALVAACSGDAGPVATPTPAGATSTPTAAVEAATPTATPGPQPAFGVALFDLQTGRSVLLPIDPSLESVEFGPGAWLTVTGNQPRYLDFAGREIPPPAITLHHLDCRTVPAGIEIGGKTFADVPACGTVSPDIGGTWMLYSVPAADVTEGGRTLSSWDQWALNRHTDERRLLQSQLLHCGGCDGRFGPLWSPDGRFVVFSELVQSGRIFLSNLVVGSTRMISQGSTEISAKPSWAENDLLLYRSSAGNPVLEHPSADSVIELSGLRWPACFDTSGSYVFGPDLAGERVAMYSVAQQRVLAVLPGSFETNGNGYPLPCPDPPPIQGRDDGFVAVLSTRTGNCAGIAVYRDAIPVGCVDLPVTVAKTRPDLRDDARSMLAASGEQVAIARITAVAPPHPCTQSPCTPPTIEALYEESRGNPFQRRHTYEVLVADTSTGTTRMLASGLVSPTPPELIWNSSSSHLLVRWPFETFSGP